MLFLAFYEAAFLTALVHLPRHDTAHSSLDLPTLISSQENASPARLMATPQAEFPSSQVCAVEKSNKPNSLFEHCGFNPWNP